jgi:hypothetical protein
LAKQKWPGAIPAIFFSVIARSASDEAIHPSLAAFMQRDGLLRFARNDVDGMEAIQPGSALVAIELEDLRAFRNRQS